MLLNIEATTSLLGQIVSPNTFLACLLTLDGRVIAYYIHPTAIVAEENEERDGTDQVKNLAAVASGLWREASYTHQARKSHSSTTTTTTTTTPSPSTSNSKPQQLTLDQDRKLNVQCELGQLHITSTPPFLLLVVGKTGSVSIETLAMKAKLLKDQLKGPFANLF